MIIHSRWFFRIFTNNFAKAMALFPFILINDISLKSDGTILNHERIHLRQQLELFILIFYLWYLIEFLIRYLQEKSFRLAYKKISFEQEAFDHQHNQKYLKSRKIWSFLPYIRKS